MGAPTMINKIIETKRITMVILVKIAIIFVPLMDTAKKAVSSIAAMIF